MAGAVVSPAPRRGSSWCRVNRTGSPSDRGLELREGRVAYYGLKKEDRLEIPGQKSAKSLQEIWDYVKRPNLHLIGVPECDKENESKLENTLQDIIQENFPNLAWQDNIQLQVI